MSRTPVSQNLPGEQPIETLHLVGADKASAQQGGRAKYALLAAADGGAATHSAAGYLLVVKLAAMPAMALLLIRWFGLTGIHADIALIFAALPASSSAYILAQRMGGDGPRVAWLISASTLIGMLSLPAWLSLR